MQLKNPCLPSIVLRERLSHVQFQKLSQARSKTGSDDKWATIAVLTEKGTKESASGRAYSIWRLSDLQGTNVSLFLFGKAQTGLWKETEGSIIAVFGPEARIADSKFSMSVDSEQQVVKLGTSVDMGFCRANKKDGTPCRNAVNINACPFCDYHVQGEYNKIRSKRSECKDSHLHRAFHHANGARLGSSGRPKMGEGGDILYSQPPTLKPRSQNQLQQTVDKARRNIPGVSRLLAAMVPAPGSLGPNRLPPATAPPHEPGPCHATRQQQASKAVSQAVRAEGQNRVGPGQAPQGMLTLQEDEVDWGSEGSDPALQHALAVIQAKGGLQAPDPNRPFQSRPQTPAPPSTSAPASRPAAAPVHGQTPYGSQPVKSQQAVTSGSGAAASKAIQGRAAPQSGGAKLQGNPQARVLVKLGLSKGQSGSNSRGGRSFAAAFGSIAASQNTERTDTRYKELVDDEDHERLTRVLTALEKKDDMQQRMEAITKLNVTAFHCKNCGSTTERRHPECRQHEVQRVTATKRWWQCCHCNSRFTTVAVRLPKTRCPKCNDVTMKFKAVSMARSVKGAEDPAFASRETFKARGTEHAFALNGHK
ncbi:MAG: MCM10 protein [Trebouxia sp. A1-2]|nr:MAG: MCM10 protein [Trebouxia sp. A1-2]